MRYTKRVANLADNQGAQKKFDSSYSEMEWEEAVKDIRDLNKRYLSFYTLTKIQITQIRIGDRFKLPYGYDGYAQTVEIRKEVKIDSKLLPYGYDAGHIIKGKPYGYIAELDFSNNVQVSK